MRLIVLAALMAGVSNEGLAQWKGPADSTMHRVISARVTANGSTGMVMGIVENGKPRFVVTGVRGGPGSAPLDPSTIFEIGSISKVFTTTLLAQMVVAGEVSLDDPAQKFLPAGVTMPSKDGKPITLLDLATASSGLPRLPALEPADSANPYSDYGEEQLYAFLSRHTLTRSPGERYEYSNLGMGLLGHLLSLKAGVPYEQLVIQRILRPLGMKETWITIPPAQRARLAQGHNRDLEAVGPWAFDVLAGAGGWRSTPKDMARFLAAMLSPPTTALGRALTMAVQSRRPTGMTDISIGLGWHIIDRNGQPLTFHNGETGGYHSYLGFNPVTGANVLILAASANDIDDIGMHQVDSTIPRRDPVVRPTVTVSEGLLEQYVGNYALAPTFAIEITRQGDRLFLRATNQQQFRLHAASETRFFVKEVPAEIGFVRDASGRVSSLVLYQNGQEAPGRKVR
ncbi:MAG: serine hydrolase [Gemmatimonadales bacterium]|nr:serine hydrolase [Gemmatimonadales bacterium]